MYKYLGLPSGELSTISQWRLIFFADGPSVSCYKIRSWYIVLSDKFPRYPGFAWSTILILCEVLAAELAVSVYREYYMSTRWRRFILH